MQVLEMVLAGVTILALSLMYVLGIRKLLTGYTSCTAHTTGKVVGGSTINYGGHIVPLCRYEVRGTLYEVAGPLFQWGNVGPHVKSNLTDREHLPTSLNALNIAYPTISHATQDNDYLYQFSSLAALYSIGSDVDIWYDPSNPSFAYVQRPCRRGIVPTIVFGSFALASVICLVIVHAFPS